MAILVLLAAGTSGNSGQDNQRPSFSAHDGGGHSDQLVPIAENQKSTGSQNELSAYSQPPHWYVLPEWWLCILGFPTLIFLGWQSWATNQAAQAASRQADITTDTAKRQLRAYLCVDEGCVKVVPDGDPGQPHIKLEAQLHIKNGGQTPAYNIESWLYGHIGSYPEHAPVPPLQRECPKA